MAESIFARIHRLLSAYPEDLVDRIEQANGPAVMREAIREIDRAMNETRADRDKATAKRLMAARHKASLEKHLEQLTEKARFALSQGREDLAEAALARQVDIESERLSIENNETQAAEDEKRLDAGYLELRARKVAMETTLSTFELARSQTEAPKDAITDKKVERERKVERAEQTFDRVMKSANGPAHTPMDLEAVSKVSEIDVLQRRALIAERLAGLKTNAAGCVK